MNQIDSETRSGCPCDARLGAVAAERERLCEFLHDGVMQSLNVAALELAHLKLELLAAAELGADSPVLPVAELLGISARLERQMRLAVGDLRGWLNHGGDVPTPSFARARQPDGNLAGALRWLVLQRLGFSLEEPLTTASALDDPEPMWSNLAPPADREVPTVYLLACPPCVTLPAAVEAEVLAILQEAILNAHRHGQARIIRLTLELSPVVTAQGPIGEERVTGPQTGEPSGTWLTSLASTGSTQIAPSDGVAVLRFVVLDDGSSPPQTLAPAADSSVKQGYGLRAMSQRASRLGAALRLGPATPNGTSVSLELPLRELRSGANGMTDLRRPIANSELDVLVGRGHNQ